MSEDKKYKNGQIQDNGYMYDDVYDYNHDGVVSPVEDYERQKEMDRSQQAWEERQQEKRDRQYYSSNSGNTGTGNSGSSNETKSSPALGIAGIVAILFFTFLIFSCVESTAAKIICLIVGIVLACFAALGFGFFG